MQQQPTLPLSSVQPACLHVRSCGRSNSTYIWDPETQQRDQVGACLVSQCAAVCCSVLYRAAVCCSVLYRAAVCCSVLYRAAVCCSVLRGPTLCETYVHGVHRSLVALCCSVLQCTAVLCSLLQSVAEFYNVLQCTWVSCCNVLQCVVLCQGTWRRGRGTKLERDLSPFSSMRSSRRFTSPCSAPTSMCRILFLSSTSSRTYMYVYEYVYVYI